MIDKELEIKLNQILENQKVISHNQEIIFKYLSIIGEHTLEDTASRQLSLDILGNSITEMAFGRRTGNGGSNR